MLYSSVTDPLLSTQELNHLNLIRKWVHQWKMSFKPDPAEQAVEIIFSQKRVKPHHPPLQFNGSLVKNVTHHKHLGLTLDSNLTYSRNFDEQIAVPKELLVLSSISQTIALLKHLINYTKCM